MTAYLVDTHLLLWAATGSARLGERATAVLTQAGNGLSFSSASIWEVAIKAGLGRTDFTIDVSRFAHLLTVAGYLELPVTSVHAVRVSTLPPIHRDPFDRLLVAQAAAEKLTLLTRDVRLVDYPVSVEVV